MPEEGEHLPAPQTEREEMGELIGRLSGTEDLDNATRGKMLARLARLLSDNARRAGVGGLRGGRWLGEVFADIAPRIPIRDLETLRRHHPGLSTQALADELTRTAVNATTAVGAAGGALAAVQFTAPPLLLTAPAQIVAETLVVAAIETKLIAELHKVHGVQVQGGTAQRAMVHVTAWAKQRGVNPLETGSLSAGLGSAAKTALRKRLLRTMGRHMTTLGPFLTGAVAGGTLNRAATKKLAEKVRDDLARFGGAKGLDRDARRPPEHRPAELPPPGPPPAD